MKVRLILHPREMLHKFKGREKKIRNKMGINEDKHFFIIRTNGNDGFFANFTFVLDNLIIASERGLIPVVDMDNFKTLYNENELLFNTHNSWEYYFKKVSPYTLEDVYKSRNIILSSTTYPEYKAIYYNREKNILPSKDQIKFLHDIIKKQIVLQPHITKKFKKQLEKFNAYNKILGVHVRGTDMYTEGRHHPRPNEKIKDLDYIKEMMDAHDIDGIMLCADEEKTIDLFKREFGDKVIVTDAMRAKEGDLTGIHRDTTRESEREKHRYLLGEEVLLDMLLLSECDYLLCGPSNVAFAAMTFNGGKYNEVFYW